MSMKDDTFAEHATWLAFQRNSLEWPKFWRAVIFKLDRRFDVVHDKMRYYVLPRNPEYQEFCDREEDKWRVRHAQPIDVVEEIPPMHLGPVEFDSMEEINNWAQVAYRLTRS